MINKIVLGLTVIASTFLFSCEQTGGSAPKYQVVNRQRALMLIDSQTGEVFMMDLVMEKGQGVVGSTWKRMGDPSQAK